jgi:hypothetical protein
MSKGKRARKRQAERRFAKTVASISARLQAQAGLPFQELLPTDLVETILRDIGHSAQDRIYTPAVTLWVFLSQVLSADHSCRAAVARLIADRAARGESTCSPETGAYCIARSRLPEDFYSRLVITTGNRLQDAAGTHESRSGTSASPTADMGESSSHSWLWLGRAVKVVDGTTVLMPDTADNQLEYPQHSELERGLGFPIARLAVIFSLAVGTVLAYAMGPMQGKKTGENQLFRSLFDRLSRGDVVLADRLYGSFWDFALLDQRGIDLVARSLRRSDFRRGTRLGPGDHLVIWDKPKRPDWMDEETYDSLPDELVLREVKVRVRIPGCRVQEFVVVTSLFDHNEYSAMDLADLYRARWNAELDLRSLKTTMQMEFLRCLTPEMVRKEIAMHLLAYNLVRTVVAEAAALTDQIPRNLSFKGAMQTITAMRDRGLLDHDHDLYHHAILLASIATHRVGDRPNRVEPRAVKRRPKRARLLTVPRAEARRRLLK